jgi:pyruvate kinase
MKLNRVKIDEMIKKLDGIIKQAKELEKRYTYELSTVHPALRMSAQNLLHYLALRHQDISNLQNRLGQLGISRLGRAESHVMASIIAIRSILQLLNKNKKTKLEKAAVAIKQGSKIINAHTTALLGKKLKGSKVRIMVTLPREAAHDKKLILNLMEAGMNCARINCAHDEKETWKLMIEKIRKAQKKTGRNCKVCMDLGGPKLRTGEMIPGPKVVHLSPARDLLGRVTDPSEVILAPLEDPPDLENEEIILPVEEEWLKQLQTDDLINFNDTREKRRQLKIGTRKGKCVIAKCYDSAYLQTGTKFELKKDEKIACHVGELAVQEQTIVLRIGDVLILHKDLRPGEPVKCDNDGNLLQAAHISCTLPQVFDDVRAGESILLDDGKIEGIIRSVTENEIQIQVTYAKEEGTKLKADKGINLPDSKLRFSGLTEKDKNDLEFIVKYTDVVNMSFVNEPQDVYELLTELDRLNASHLGIILKIETKRGFKNLPAILLAAMNHHPIGVMIARGDLAIEAGWKHLAQIQEELLWLCEAAHIPIVWATQVLETLAKKGIPSRAEITDASMAQRAECVMLNKGPHIVQTIKMLDEIMQSMEEYHQKQAPMIPVLKSSDYLNY